MKRDEVIIRVVFFACAGISLKSALDLLFMPFPFNWLSVPFLIIGVLCAVLGIIGFDTPKHRNPP